ncbi:MAG: type II secretion system F family protein, partial [Chloroflexi bacterium]|nr:type II secretion system F family protein [Chloroflexota bacterium]
AKGVSLPEASARRRLPEFYVKMVQAGAQSNDLPGMLTLLANYYQKLNNIWVRLKGLMVYPAIVLAGMLALSLFFMFLIESLAEGVVQDVSQAWVFTTRFTVALWLPTIVLLLIGAVVLLVFFVPACRRSLRWRLPGFKEAGLSQAASMTGLMLESGTNLNSALGLLKDIESGTLAGADIARWQTRLAGGHAKFAEMTSGSKVFPPLFCWLVAGGGENLAEGFRRAAEIYYARAVYRIEMLLYVAMPVSVLVLGLLIVSQVYPMLQMFGTMVTLLDSLGG